MKEINELRFVLCPKRMNDAQFWIVYFSLARKYMPPEAFDPGFEVPKDAAEGDSQRRLLDLQTGIRKTFETARQTASKWRDRATNTLQPAGKVCAYIRQACLDCKASTDQQSKSIDIHCPATELSCVCRGEYLLFLL